MSGGMREERKVVTALFADVVGSTALTERLDPEDAMEVLGGAVARMIAAVESFGGTVKDLAGDGALALFGAPVAHEDDAQRAVRAGLAIVRSMEVFGDELRRRGLDAVSVRVGIETGLAVLGPVGAGSKVEYGAVGDALNTAARLQSRAEPGTVLVGEGTLARAEPYFEWGDPLLLELKGKAQPVEARPVVSVRERPGSTRGLEGVQAVLVGRDLELAMVREFAAGLRSRRGAVLAVVGEAGMGKSRLLRELASSLPEGSDWYEGRCASYTEGIPFGPFRELLTEGLGGATPSASLASARERLGDAADEVAPFLALLLGVADHEDAARVSALSPATLGRELVDAIRAVLRSVRAERPAVVAIEDLHWSDSSSLELLDRLTPLAASDGLLLALTSRREAGHPSASLLDRLGATDGCRVLELSSLAAGADRRLLGELVGTDVLPAAVEARLLAAAEGNPFFLEESVRSLRDAGALRREAGGWRLVRDVEVEIPSTVEQVILARLDRLAPLERDVADAASVIGRRFDLQLLRSVADAPGGAIDGAIAALRELDVIGGGPPPEPYVFAHALIQEAAYRALVRRRRSAMHMRAAQALEPRTREEPGLAGVVGRHYRAAGEAGLALGWIVRSAREAANTFAADEALRAYADALAAAEEAGLDARTPPVREIRLERGALASRTGDHAVARTDLETALRTALLVGDADLECRTELELGFDLAGAANYRAAVPHLERALALAIESGEAASLVTAEARLSIVQTNLLRLDLGREHGQRALGVARGEGDQRLVALALDALKQVELQLGDHRALEAIADELERMLRRLGDPWLLQFVLFERGYLAAETARWAEAEGRIREALDLNLQIADRGNEPLFLGALGRLRRFQGRYGEALETGQRAVAHARSTGHAEWTAWSELFLGIALLDLGALDEALSNLAAAADASQRGGAELHLVRAQAHLARCRWLRGDLASAYVLADAARGRLEATSTPAGMAHLAGSDAYVAVGELLLEQGRVDEAIGLVRPVVEASDRMGWLETQVTGGLVLGRCAEAQGSEPEARERFRRAADVAASAGAPFLELQARAALARLPSDRRDADARATDRMQRLTTALCASIPDEKLRDGFFRAATALVRRGGGMG